MWWEFFSFSGNDAVDDDGDDGDAGDDAVDDVMQGVVALLSSHY